MSAAKPSRMAFEGALLKVQRAESHIRELQAILLQISRMNDAALAVHSHSDGTNYLTFNGRALGATIPCVIGDAVHNMRAVFDHLWVAMLKAATPEDADNARIKFAYFPFRKDWDGVKNAITTGDGSKVISTFPKVEEIILDKIKPYRDPDGNATLWYINKIDKIDKHNLLIPVITINRFSATATIDGRKLRFTDCATDSDAFLVSSRPIKQEGQSKFTLDVTFPEDSPLAGKPVLPSLVDMAKATSEAVELFREIFL